MKFDVTRRNLMFGAGGFAAGGAITGIVGFKFRDQIRRILGVSRPNIDQLGLATGTVDEWLLTPEDREELSRHLAANTVAE
jgi:hypothetical protein